MKDGFFFQAMKWRAFREFAKKYKQEKELNFDLTNDETNVLYDLDKFSNLLIEMQNKGMDVEVLLLKFIANGGTVSQISRTLKIDHKTIKQMLLNVKQTIKQNEHLFTIND
jgi:DNA-binding NarL/FixJ family response regulator